MESIPKSKSHLSDKIFYVILFSVILVSIGVTYYKIVVKENYQIEAQVSCDPKTEKCFVSTCDPTTDDTCPTDPSQQTTYYKEISKEAATISACEATPDKIGCNGELSCTVGEINCSYKYCDPAHLEDGDQCAQ